MSDSFYYKCEVCREMFPVVELKYHTPESEPPVVVFCGAECSFKYHINKEQQEKDYESSEIR